MKQSFICLILLNVLFVSCQEFEAPHDEDLNQIDEYAMNEVKGDCVLANQLNQTGGTQRITDPGVYCLVEPITVSTLAGIGFIIDADNVVFDLNQQTITGNRNTVGIQVQSNRTNVSIVNGTIRFHIGTGVGIFVNQGNRLITIDGITFLNNTNALRMSGVNNFVIRNCIAQFTTGSAFFISNNVVGIAQNGLIEECVLYNNGDSALSLVNCNNVDVNKVQCNNNATNGFFQSGGINIVYQECDANSNTIGFSINGDNNILIGCSAETNRIAPNATGFIINGNQNTVESCQAISNLTDGFRISGLNNCILNSEAKNNGGSGFFLTAASSQNQVRNNTAVFNLVGFNNAGTLNRIYGNYASDNTTNYIGIPNVVVSPTAVAAINHTANIAN